MARKKLSRQDQMNQLLREADARIHERFVSPVLRLKQGMVGNLGIIVPAYTTVLTDMLKLMAPRLPAMEWSVAVSEDGVQVKISQNGSDFTVMTREANASTVSLIFAAAIFEFEAASGDDAPPKASCPRFRDLAKLPAEVLPALHAPGSEPELVIPPVRAEDEKPEATQGGSDGTITPVKPKRGRPRKATAT